MDAFDVMIKKQAKGEKVIVPEGFTKRIEHLVKELPQKSRLKRKSYRLVFLAAAILVMSVVTVLATPNVLDMTEGAISFFQVPSDFRYLSKQAVFEKFNAEVGIQTTDNEISITLDNIAMDDNYILVFYTMESEKPIELLGSEDTPMKWRLRFTAPVFWFKADSRYIEPASSIEKDAYLIDEHTLKGMQRFTLLDHYKNSIHLEMYANSIMGTEGNWHIAVDIDKSNVSVKSTTVTPNLKVQFSGGLHDLHTHHVTIKKISISPFGSQIVFSERGNRTFSNFALRDQSGNYLTLIPKGTASHRLFKIDNSFEFIPSSMDMESITIIPVYTAERSERKYISRPLNYPVTLQRNEMASYLLQSVDIDSEKMIAVFYQDGPVPMMTPTLIPSAEDGSFLSFSAYVDEEYDRQTGAITITHYWQKPLTSEDLESIKGFSYFADNQFVLNEEEAVTIPLR